MKKLNLQKFIMTFICRGLSSKAVHENHVRQKHIINNITVVQLRLSFGIFF